MSRKTAGFRLSWTDLLFIALMGIGAILFRAELGDHVWVIPIAVGHFFLFCNVFRVRRAYELAWVAVFFVNVAAWAASGRLSWLGVLAAQAPFTLLAIGLEMKSPQYHGIAWRRLNEQRVEEWLRS